MTAPRLLAVVAIGLACGLALPTYSEALAVTIVLVSLLLLTWWVADRGH